MEGKKAVSAKIFTHAISTNALAATANIFFPCRFTSFPKQVCDRALCFLYAIDAVKEKSKLGRNRPVVYIGYI